MFALVKLNKPGCDTCGYKALTRYKTVEVAQILGINEFEVPRGNLSATHSHEAF